jgi:hypothetical protein
MRFGKNFALSILLAIFACPVLIAGCKTQNTTEINQQEPPDYRQWEGETHRQHVDLDKRSAEEQKEYRDWHQDHSRHP